nr:ORF1 [Torque teno felis virus]
MWRRKRWRRGRSRWRRRGLWRKHRRHWRRRFPRKRTVRTKVYENLPYRHRYITVQGWEPLANVCKQDTARMRAEPYRCLEPSSSSQGQWHGTWGFHYLTLNNLQLRAKGYWNMWSDNWASFDYVTFLGAKIRIPPDQLHSWMISFDPFFQAKEVFPLQPKDFQEQTWIHPGIMINRPNTHMILPQNYHSRSKFYTIRVRPPPGWKGAQRLPDALNYILLHWGWTFFNLNQAFYDVCNCEQPNTDACSAEPWWCANKYYDKWVNREKYEDCAPGNNNRRNWGPFLPAKNCSPTSFSPFFLYKLYFKFSGDSIWRPLPSVYANTGLIPEAPGPKDVINSKADNKKRPRDIFDILPGDLDSDGILKDGALERITEHHRADKRRKMVPAKRLRHIAVKLRNILDQRGLLRRGVRTPVGVPTTCGWSPDHPPQKK